MIVRLPESPYVSAGPILSKYRPDHDVFLEGVVRKTCNGRLRGDYEDVVVDYPVGGVHRYRRIEGSSLDFTSSARSGVIVDDHREGVVPTFSRSIWLTCITSN